MNDGSARSRLRNALGENGAMIKGRDFLRERARPFIENEVTAVMKLGISRLLFIAIVIVPSVLAIIYYGFWASGRYASQSLMTVRSSEAQIATAFGGLLGSLGANPGAVDGYVVQEYIQSREIVGKLQEELDIQTLYAVPEADVWSRIAADASLDDLYDYYLDRIDVYFDATANVVHLEAQAYRAEDAQKIAQLIVRFSDEMVNRISQQSRLDAVKFARDEVTLAEDRLRDNRMALYKFREEHGELDPVSSAAAIGGIVANLEAELSRYKTELASLRSYMRDDAPQIAGVLARIGAIEQQMRAERSRLTSSEDTPNVTYSDLLSEYERLSIEEEFARSAYTSAVTALEIARADANRKQAYLVAFVEPSLPADPSKPERLLNIVSVLLGGLLAYGLLMLIGAAIREHARI